MTKSRTLTDHAAVAAALTLAALAATPASAQSVGYEVTDLGAPIGGATFGSALNNVGQATGDSGNTGAPGGVGAQAFRFELEEGMIISPRCRRGVVRSDLRGGGDPQLPGRP